MTTNIHRSDLIAFRNFLISEINQVYLIKIQVLVKETCTAIGKEKFIADAVYSLPRPNFSPRSSTYSLSDQEYEEFMSKKNRIDKTKDKISTFCSFLVILLSSTKILGDAYNLLPNYLQLKVDSAYSSTSRDVFKKSQEFDELLERFKNNVTYVDFIKFFNKESLVS